MHFLGCRIIHAKHDSKNACSTRFSTSWSRSKSRPVYRTRSPTEPQQHASRLMHAQTHKHQATRNRKTKCTCTSSFLHAHALGERTHARTHARARARARAGAPLRPPPRIPRRPLASGRRRRPPRHRLLGRRRGPRPGPHAGGVPRRLPRGAAGGRRPLHRRRPPALSPLLAGACSIASAEARPPLS